MTRAGIISIVLTTLLTSACVMKSTYDAAVTELNETRAELDRAKEQKQLLARQAAMLEEATQEATRKAESAAAAVRQSQEDADAERKASEDRIARLKRTIALLTAAQSRLRGDLQTAKEQTPKLTSSVDMFRTKMGDIDNHRPLSSPAQTASTPDTASPKEAQPSVTANPASPSTLTSPPPSAPSEPATTARRPANRQDTAQPEESLFSIIKGWLVSLWRSVFS